MHPRYQLVCRCNPTRWYQKDATLLGSRAGPGRFSQGLASLILLRPIPSTSIIMEVKVYRLGFYAVGKLEIQFLHELAWAEALLVRIDGGLQRLQRCTTTWAPWGTQWANSQRCAFQRHHSKWQVSICLLCLLNGFIKCLVSKF